MSVSQQQIELDREWRQAQIESDRAIVRRLETLTGVWKSCPTRLCRRRRFCTGAGTCGEPHRTAVRRLRKKKMFPLLWARFPGVDWHTPGLVLAQQVAVALEATRFRLAKAEGRMKERPDAPAKSR
jgi:hypothetical protein